ncbi:MAG: nitrilase-related carbon-nitrogen hydrolase [Candidatus Zixiibacteriota bacterium]
MKIKLGIVQFKPLLGEVDKNFKLHLRYLLRAKREKVDLLLFPELSFTGYHIKDLTLKAAIRPDDPPLKRLARQAGAVSLLVGFVEESRDFKYYNSAAYIESGKVISCHRKLYLPTYGMFDEGRYFARGGELKAVDTKFGRVGVLICEDAWHSFCPQILAIDGVWLIINIANATSRGASKKAFDSTETWETMNRFYARMHCCYVAFVNRCGLEDGVSFWGGSEVIAPDGGVVAKSPYLEDDFLVVTIDTEEVRGARFSSPLLRDERLDLIAAEIDRLRKLRL